MCFALSMSKKELTCKGVLKSYADDISMSFFKQMNSRIKGNNKQLPKNGETHVYSDHTNTMYLQ